MGSITYQVEKKGAAQKEKRAFDCEPLDLKDLSKAEDIVINDIEVDMKTVNGKPSDIHIIDDKGNSAYMRNLNEDSELNLLLPEQE